MQSLMRKVTHFCTYCILFGWKDIRRQSQADKGIAGNNHLYTNYCNTVAVISQDPLAGNARQDAQAQDSCIY